MVQKYQVHLEGLRDIHTRAIELEEDKKSLQAALDAKDEQLKEEVCKNTDLEEAIAEVDMLNDEVDNQARLAADLITTMNQQSVESKSALEGQKAEFKSALERQKADLEEKFQAELDAAYD